MVQSQASPHRCSHCTREFARSEHLVRHERTHTKEKPFECPQCGLVFSRQDLLKRHERKEHDHRPHGRGKNLRSSCLQSKFPAQPVEQLPLPSVPYQNPSPQTNGTHFNSIPSPNTHLMGQIITNGEQSPQLPPSTELWTGGPSQWPGSNSDNIPLAQNDPFPYDLDWLDTLPATFNDSDLNLSLASVPQVQREEQGTSVLSRPGSPSPPEETGSTSTMLMHPRAFTISEDHRQRMQSEVNKFSAYILPPRMALSQFIQRYFKTFHRHMPFIHESTWMPEEAAVPLVLAICANGAIYSLERDVARNLHQSAVAMMKPIDTGLWALQTLMLLIAFAVWSGKIEDLRTGLQLRGGLTLLLRQEWSEMAKRPPQTDMGWVEWRALESMKRTTFCLFTLFNLMQVAYDIPSPLLLEDQYGMPFHEVQWRAGTEAEWQIATAKLQPQEWLTAQEIVRRLGDEALPTPSNIGIFGCHVIISTLLQKIILFRQSCSSNDYGFLELRQKYIRALRRWQTMWESEPDSSLSPDHPCGPILFNGTAILRVAYIRLAADFSQIRRAFSFCDSPEDIEAKINLLEIPLRDPQTTRAALQACLALRIPVHLGFKIVSKTSFWMWSVQHSLCYFECALLLSKWVRLMEDSSELSEEEHEVLALVSKVLNASGSEDPHAISQNLPAAVLRSWARLLDTGDMTVWQIQPKMAHVLRLHAAR